MSSPTKSIAEPAYYFGDTPLAWLGGGELAQVVDAKAFFDIGDFIDHPLKAGLAEPAVLLVFEDLSQVAKLLRGGSCDVAVGSLS